MYPGYKPREVLDEYAITFFALLNEGYRQRNENYLMQTKIAAVPIMKTNVLNDFIQQLEWASKATGDILSSSGEGSSPAEIKKLLQG